jgi:tetratricopeptide (TPR) repeat protein
MAAAQHRCQDIDIPSLGLSWGLPSPGSRLAEMKILDDVAAVSGLDTWLRAARPDDDRIAGDADAARKLAGACGRLPLALWISAALLQADPALSASDLADEIGAARHRLRSLWDGGAGPGVSGAVTVFELAYRKVPERVARVFRLTSVHPGPDASAATVEVLADQPASEVRGALAALAQVHLVETASGGTGRWRMHDLVRLYARHLSDAEAQADGRDFALDRLLGYYLSMTEAADGQVRGRPGLAYPAAFISRDDALAWLDAERSSLTAAVGMAADLGRDYIAASLSLFFAQYLARRRLFDDLLTITTIGLSAARRLGDRDLEGSALTNLGLAQQELGRPEEAIVAHEDAVARFRAVGDLDGAGDALNNLGLAFREEGRFEEAIAAHRGAAVIYRETGNRRGEAGALNNLGLALKRVQCLDEAIASHEDAAVIYRETGDRHGEGMALGNLGGVLRDSGRSGEAIDAWRGAACIFGETGDQPAHGIALSSLGGVLAEVGRSEEAVTAYREAASVFRATGDREREDMALASLVAAAD